jgi:hypothetical protein
MNLLEVKAGGINGYVLLGMKEVNGIEVLAFFCENEEEEIIENEIFQDHLQEVDSFIPAEEGAIKQIKKLTSKHLKNCCSAKVCGQVKLSPLPKKFFKRLKEKTLLTIEGGLPIPTNDDE